MAKLKQILLKKKKKKHSRKLLITAFEVFLKVACQQSAEVTGAPVFRAMKQPCRWGALWHCQNCKAYTKPKAVMRLTSTKWKFLIVHSSASSRERANEIQRSHYQYEVNIFKTWLFKKKQN